MKKFFIYLFLLILAFVSFFMSGLFFLNSGIINFNEETFDEVRAVEILRGLEEIPFVYFDSEEIKFFIYGDVLDIEGTSVLVGDRDKKILFEEVNVSGIFVGDELIVVYQYDEDYNIVVLEIEKD